METDCSEDIPGHWINFILQSHIDLQTINYINPILAIWRVDGNKNIEDISPNNNFQNNVPPFSPTNISGVYFSQFETGVTADDFTAWRIIYRRNDFHLNQNFSNSLKLYHQYWMFSRTDLSGLFTDPSYSNFLSNFFRIKNHNTFGLEKNEVLDTSINRILFLANNFDTFLTEVSGTTFDLRSIDDSINTQLLTTGQFTFKGGLDISNTITIHIPNGIQTIDLNPDNLNEVPRQIFPNLRNIYFDNSSNLTEIGNFSFRRNIELREVFFPSKLETIGEKSFFQCANLRSVYLDNISEIGNQGFFQCIRLVSAVITNNAPLTLIPQYCFQDCISLRSFTVPTNIKTISEYAFQQCVSLDNFIFPLDASSIQYIGENAFAFCSNLRIFEFPINNSINDISLELLFFGDSIQNKINKVNHFSELITLNTLNDNIHNEPDNFNIIEENTVSNNKGIGRYAFMHCTSLQRINLEDTNIRIINEGLFLNCTSLTEIIIPNTVTTIDTAAFLNCAKLKNVLFRGEPNELFNAEIINRFISQNGKALLVTNIGQSFQLSASQVSLVQNIQTLSQLYANNRLSIINDLGFANCTNLETIVIPPNVTHIGNLAFLNCEKLKYIYILGSLPAPFNSLLNYRDSSIFGSDDTDNVVTNTIIIDSINNLFNSKHIYPNSLGISGEDTLDFSNITEENLGGVGMSYSDTVNIIYVSDLSVGNNPENQLKTNRLPRDIIKIPSNLEMGNDPKFTSKSPQVIIYDIRSQFITNMNGFFTSNTINNIPDVYDLTLGQFKQNPDTPINLFSNTQTLEPVNLNTNLVNNPTYGFFGAFSTINSLFEQYVNNAVNNAYTEDNNEIYTMIENFITKFDNNRNYCIDVKDASNEAIIGYTDFILFNENFLTNITSASLEFEIDTFLLKPFLSGFQYFAFGIEIMRKIFIGGPDSGKLILKYFGAWAKDPPVTGLSVTSDELLDKYVNGQDASFNYDPSTNIHYFVDDGSYQYHRQSGTNHGYDISNTGVVSKLVPATYNNPEEVELLKYLNNLRRDISSIDQIFIYSDKKIDPLTYHRQEIPILRCSFFEILGFPIRRVSLSNSLVTFDNEGFQSVLSNWSFKGGDGGQINPPRFGTENMFANITTLDTEKGYYWDPSGYQRSRAFANLFDPSSNTTLKYGDFTLGELVGHEGAHMYRFTKSGILKDIFSYDNSNSLVNTNQIYQVSISGSDMLLPRAADASSNDDIFINTNYYRNLFFMLQVILLQYPLALQTLVILLTDILNSNEGGSVSLFYAWLKTSSSNKTFFNTLNSLNINNILTKVTDFTTNTLTNLMSNSVTNNLESEVFATGSQIHELVTSETGFGINRPQNLTKTEVDEMLNSGTPNNSVLDQVLNGSLSLINDKTLTATRDALNTIRLTSMNLRDFMHNRTRTINRQTAGVFTTGRGVRIQGDSNNYTFEHTRRIGADRGYVTDPGRSGIGGSIAGSTTGLTRLTQNTADDIFTRARDYNVKLNTEIREREGRRTNLRDNIVDVMKERLNTTASANFDYIMSKLQRGNSVPLASLNFTETYINSLDDFVTDTSGLIDVLNAVDLSGQFKTFFENIFLLRVFKDTKCPLSISGENYKSHVDGVSERTNDNINGYIWSSFVAFSGLLPSQDRFSIDLSSIVQNIYLDNRFSTSESFSTLQTTLRSTSQIRDYLNQISKLQNITYGKILTEYFSILSSYINIRNRWRTSEVYKILLGTGQALQSQTVQSQQQKLMIVNGNIIQPSVDLSNQDLTDANLINADLRDAILINTNLTNANLSGSRLSGATLINTNFTNANMSSAILTSADLRNANMSDAILTSADLSGCDLSGADLKGADLTGADLTDASMYGATLININFSNANLKHAKLIGADLTGTNLSGADLTSANLSGATLINTNFTNANMSSAILTSADLRNANMSGATLTNADLSGAKLNGTILDGAILINAILINAILKNSDFSKAVMTNADLIGVDLSGAILTGAILTGADLSGLNFSGADLININFSNANLTRAILTGANLTDANLTDASMSGAILNSAILTNANLTDADLTDASMSGAILINTDLTRADMSGADLSGVNLTNAILSGTNMSGAILTDVILTGADLRNVNMSSANLQGANLEERNLSGANLSKAILSDANLKFADLSGAYLEQTDFSGANLRGATLRRANFTKAKLIGATLINVSAEYTNFHHANFENARAGGGTFNYANFENATLTGATFTYAILTNAIFTDAQGISREHFYEANYTNAIGLVFN